MEDEKRTEFANLVRDVLTIAATADTFGFDGLPGFGAFRTLAHNLHAAAAASAHQVLDDSEVELLAVEAEGRMLGYLRNGELPTGELVEHTAA